MPKNVVLTIKGRQMRTAVESLFPAWKCTVAQEARRVTVNVWWNNVDAWLNLDLLRLVVEDC